MNALERVVQKRGGIDTLESGPLRVMVNGCVVPRRKRPVFDKNLQNRCLGISPFRRETAIHRPQWVRIRTRSNGSLTIDTHVSAKPQPALAKPAGHEYRSSFHCKFGSGNPPFNIDTNTLGRRNVPWNEIKSSTTSSHDNTPYELCTYCRS